MQRGMEENTVHMDLTRDLRTWTGVVRDLVTNFSLSIVGPMARLSTILDTSAGYGSFAAALKQMKSSGWVMNVVPRGLRDVDTLPFIFDRGLVGTYHDWCMSFPAYPRSFDLIHMPKEFFTTQFQRGVTDKARLGGCTLEARLIDVDRLLRPGGYAVVTAPTKTMSSLHDTVLPKLRWRFLKESLLSFEGAFRVTQVWQKPYMDDWDTKRDPHNRKGTWHSRMPTEAEDLNNSIASTTRGVDFATKLKNKNARMKAAAKGRGRHG